MGVLCFLGVALIMPSKPHDPFMAYVAAAVAALNIGIRFIVPGVMDRAQLKKLPSSAPEELVGRLFAIYQTRMIVGLAILEGAAFFNLISYVVERQSWTLAIVGLLLVLMAMMFPTLNQFENWIEDIKRDLASQF